MVTIPAALFGTWMAAWFPADALRAILGMGLLAVALSFLRTPTPEDIERLDGAIEEDQRGKTAETCLVTAAGDEICYTVCNRAEGALMSGIGAVFMGLVSTGLGEMNAYFLLKRCRVPSAVSVATSVLVVAVTALIAAGGHLYGFARSGGDALPTVASLVVFTVPGVIIGGQFGAAVAARIPQHTLERALGILFVLVAALMFSSVLM